MSKRRHIVVRTVRNGQVRINGVCFRPAYRKDGLVYDGRLDNQRFAFGLYWGPPNYSYYDEMGLCREFVCLWGTETALRSNESGTDWPGPNCINGTFKWEWWDAVKVP